MPFIAGTNFKFSPFFPCCCINVNFGITSFQSLVLCFFLNDQLGCNWWCCNFQLQTKSVRPRYCQNNSHEKFNAPFLRPQQQRVDHTRFKCTPPVSNAGVFSFWSVHFTQFDTPLNIQSQSISLFFWGEGGHEPIFLSTADRQGRDARSWLMLNMEKPMPTRDRTMAVFSMKLSDLLDTAPVDTPSPWKVMKQWIFRAFRKSRNEYHSIINYKKNFISVDAVFDYCEIYQTWDQLDSLGLLPQQNTMTNPVPSYVLCDGPIEARVTWVFCYSDHKAYLWEAKKAKSMSGETSSCYNVTHSRQLEHTTHEWCKWYYILYIHYILQYAIQLILNNINDWAITRCPAGSGDNRILGTIIQYIHTVWWSAWWWYDTNHTQFQGFKLIWTIRSVRSPSKDSSSGKLQQCRWVALDWQAQNKPVISLLSECYSTALTVKKPPHCAHPKLQISVLLINREDNSTAYCNVPSYWTAYKVVSNT